MEATEDHFTPGQILDTEEKYPGLLDNVSVVRLQRLVISDQ